MSSMNKAILIGRLGQDPEVRYMPNGDAAANVSIATSDRWKDKASGEMKEATEWHRVSFFGRLAEIVGEYLKKGSLVYVEGQIRTRKWQDKDGNDRYTTEIRAGEMRMLGSKKDSEGGQQSGPESAPARQAAAPKAAAPKADPAKKPAGKFDDMEDDIPF